SRSRIERPTAHRQRVMKNQRIQFSWVLPSLLAAFCAHGSSQAAQEAASETLTWGQLPSLPDALGLAGAFAGVSGGALIVAGGANFPNGFVWQGGKKVWQDKVYALDDPKGAWKVAGKLSRPLAYGVSVTTTQGVICIGGSDAERHYTDVFRLEWKDGALKTQPLPSLPIPLANAAGARAVDTIYIAGGADQPGELTALNKLFALDLAAAPLQWKELESCPGAPRQLAAAAAVDGAFFLIGGFTPQTSETKTVRRYLLDAWRYDPRQGWKRIADLPHPVVAAPSPAPALGASRFLLISGDDGSKLGFQPIEQHPGFSNEILSYGAITDTWRVAGAAPVARATAPVVEWRGQFLIVSGEVRPCVRSPQIWAFSAPTPQPGSSQPN
ncbi:MAG: hypothetical protein NTX50_12985, partial [Candidatus Sumerlaeota bacterium]|nr:hypothetical protein [Candidatus Sumerlaeota bacterium]